jgi:arylsulfatase A-like enzyme
LVDRTVGEIREILEQAGLWDSTTLLITSDHGFRPAMWRGRMGWNDKLEKVTAPGRSGTVPFILRLPGQTQGMVFSQSFSNVVSADLVLAILNGQISTYQDASDWLMKNATP